MSPPAGWMEPPEQCPAAFLKNLVMPQEEQRMGDEPLKPRTIGVIDQMLSASVVELGQVAKWVSDWLRLLAFAPVPRRCAASISDPSLVHAFVLPFALPVEALQHLRQQRFAVQCFVPSSPAKSLWSLPWMFQAHFAHSQLHQSPEQ